MPARPSTFIGRKSELAHVARLLASADLVTLVGPAGAGKTRLALEAARRARRPTEMLMVTEVAPLHDLGQLETAIAASFGVVATGAAALESLLAWLRDRPALLLLDNCEHLRDECADTVARLLAGCPQLRVLATSREALGIGSEERWSVPPLTLPAESDTARWRRSDAVRLFEDRARRAMPGFAMNAANAELVVGICQALEGLPLAIELAASRLRNLSLPDVRRELDGQLRLLAPPAGGGGSGRHDTMRRAIDWSHDRLGERERRVFRRLAVFDGGFTAPAAEAVCADESTPRTQVVPTVSVLVERSLVQLSGGGRYALLEVLRQYAAEQLDDSGERDTSERLRATYVARLFDEFDPGHAQRAMETLRPIIADQANVRAAMRWSLVHEPPLARPVLGKLWLAYIFPRPGTDPAEVERWLELGLQDTGATNALRARILVGLAQRRFARGDRSGSAAAAAKALELATACADDHMIGSSHHRLALSAQAAGQPADALKHFSDAAAHYEGVSPGGLAWTLAQRAQVRSQAGDPAGARADFDAALVICDRMPQHWRVRAIVRTLEGEHLIDVDPVAARVAFGEVLRAFQQLGSEVPVARALRGLAEIAAAQDPERALRLAGAADDLRARVGDTWPTRPGGERLARAAARSGARAAASLAEGRRMSADEAVSYALRSAKLGQGQLALSPREREVAALVAEGLTSREIAYRLRITDRTAENHVEHILVKLGLRSRSQIARWQAERDLAP